MRRTRPALARRSLLVGLPSLGLAGCAGGSGLSAPGSDVGGLLAAHGLEGLSAREIIDRLEAVPLAQRPTNLMASVLPDRLDLSDSTGRTAALPLPNGRSYVSVAPFVDSTHECFFHSLTTCLGELQEQEVLVLVSAADGEVLLDEARTTAPNGFLGLWLPRDRDLILEISRDGASASTPLTTDAESPTCLTTVQLQG